ncbi:MAG: EscU/YscU/HrcU family type III secretion system export apparatus switch protein [Synergistaceae bacterium]|jgi:flagellar biosynthesis protein|nr:EscU/YscU/HrcU family type III secretion system export apparatus switch protein [Synergistaceae bacterium]
MARMPDSPVTGKKKTKAAALQYEIGADRAPKVIAKGENFIAEKIIEAAIEAEIPIVEDAALVSALLVLELGEEIPTELYQSVAKILAFLYKLDKKGPPR